MHRDTFLTVVAIVLILMVGWTVLSTAMSAEMRGYVEKSEQWCDDRGGELHNSRAIVHGGLHCELENGTLVHMSDVVEVETDD